MSASVKIPISGVCKFCFAKVGYDSFGELVHTRHLKPYCNGKSGKKAELR